MIEPVYRDQLDSVFRGDALDLLAALPDASVDASVDVCVRRLGWAVHQAPLMEADHMP